MDWSGSTKPTWPRRCGRCARWAAGAGIGSTAISHVGQFLRAADTVLVTDFDGNPLQDVGGRGAAQSPLRDVASMVQSIEHVGAVVVKRRRPDRFDDVERFKQAAAAAALDAYRAVHLVDDRLLLAFRVAQELHEYAYSIRHLPHWRYVADAALPSLLRSS